MQAYVLPIVHLLAALMRSSNVYSFPKSHELIAVLSQLSMHLSHKCATTTLVHNVFMVLWTTHWQACKQVRMPDPTMCFLALFTLKSTGDFKLPKDVTGPIAKLCRAIQLTMVQEIHRGINEGDYQHQEEAINRLKVILGKKRSQHSAP